MFAALRKPGYHLSTQIVRYNPQYLLFVGTTEIMILLGRQKSAAFAFCSIRTGVLIFASFHKESLQI